MPQQNPPRWSGLNLVLLWVNLALVLVLVFRFWSREHMQAPVPGEKNAQLHPVEARERLFADELTNINIFEQNSPCTVTVNVTTFERDPDSFDVLRVPQGMGTGFIWDTWERDAQKWGRIVTNFHVISHARMQDGKINPQSIQVTLADHSVWRVIDVNFDEDKDLAVLWTDAPAGRLQFIKVGDSHSLKVGQKVYAIGNPFGLNQSLTTGIISALDREIRADKSRTIRGLIQTDASINPGNSGGPLLDSAGRLIGVNTAIVSPTGASAGIGFAIAVDEVNQVVTSLIRKVPVFRPSLGVRIAADGVLRSNGVLILNVQPDGPAAKAGLKPTVRDRLGNVQLGDIIVAIDDKKIDSTKDLAAVITKCQVGQEIKMTVLRGDKEETVKLTLGAVSK